MSHASAPTPRPYGFYPFWFWNGDLTEDEIRWQVAQMAAQGIRGFYIHPRQGLCQPYLSDAFFRMVQVALEAAEEHGLVLNLYDEFPYPSGVAGGEVVLGEPQFHATHLVQRSYDLPGGPLRQALPRGKVLSCWAYPLEGGRVDWSRGVDLRDAVGTCLPVESYNEMGLTRYNRKRYFASDPTPTLEVTLGGPHRVYVSVQAVVDDHKYWGHYVDALNPQAIRRFIDLTHERYLRHFGARFGQSIHAIFVDETAPGWSARVPAEFRAAYGYDLLPLMPALQDASHPRHLQVSYDLSRLTYRLFCEAFEEQIAGWCREHGLAYAGEKPSRRLAQLAYMDIPGGDPGHTKAGAVMDLLRPNLRQNARATASAAYFYGKEGALCECFHSVGWSGTLQDAKLISEGLLLMGTRYLVPHGFFYSTHSMAKHDAPPTFFFQMPYWPHYGALSKRVDAIAAQFEGTHIDANLLLVDPNSGLPTRAHLAQYEQLLHAMMAEHLDYLIVDTDILEAGEIRAGRVTVRDVTAGVVAVPPMRVIEPPLAEWLARFDAAGGRVLHLPEGQEAAASARLLAESAAPSLRISAPAGDVGRLWAVRRAAGGRALWFLVNTANQTLDAAIDAGRPLREVALGSAPVLLRRSGAGYRRAVAPFESFLLEAAPQEVAGGPASLAKVVVPVQRPTRVTPLNANLLRLGDWQMTLRDDAGTALQTERVTPMPLPNQLAQGGFRFAPNFRLFFGCAPAMSLPQLHVDYQYSFACDYAGAVTLVIEPGSLAGDWEIRVNDGAPLREGDLAPTELHVRGSLGVDVTPFLRQGENTITVSLATDRIDGGLLNPLYLAGGFGVLLDPVRLVEFCPRGGYQTWEENGLPYYAGTVEYETTFPLDAVPAGERALLEIAHGLPFQDAIEVSVNGGEWVAMPWSPYRAEVASSLLRAGENSLRIRVFTTLIRAFEGTWFDIDAHTYREVGSGREVVDVDRRAFR
jgi:hypothetical protein